mmetsp:Transcript_37382/g.49138  ORF Transcript_37382/g.49138 Transcript_37382/m.49138 type:complete len:149 (+) Transcript_37382:694-1140(+)
MKREGRVQERFIDDMPINAASFRKTTREFHVEKEHRKLLHGAPIGRYSPTYDRVWIKAPEISIAGVKDRFGYGNVNSPNFVKPAEGQISAAGSIPHQRRRRNSSRSQGSKERKGPNTINRNKINKTAVAFNQRSLSRAESNDHVPATA